MSLRRIMDCGSLLYNKFHMSLPLFSVFSKRNMTLRHPSFFSSLSNSNKSLEFNKNNAACPTPLVIPSRGMKLKGKLQLRCKDCYFERKDGEMFVMCSSYPRHKQKLRTKKPRYYWILTHATQSKVRPY